jgi:sarcosine oxidase subunit gamma
MADGYVRISRPAPPGMVSLRADLGAAKVKAAVRALAAEMPEQRRVAMAGEAGAAWMSPDELLLFCPAGAAPSLVAALDDRLAGQHHLAADVSDMRAMWDLEGERVREVLAKLTPADAFALAPGEIRRSRLGQVAAAFWLTGPASARVVAFRSVEDYVSLLLAHACRAGSEVD